MEQYSLDEVLMKNCRIINVVYYDDVDKSEQNPAGKRCDLVLEYDGAYPVVCDKCGNKMLSHGTRTMRITDTTFTGVPAKLQIHNPRRRCDYCGNIWSPSYESIVEKHKMTRRVYEQMASLSLKHSFNDIGKMLGVSKNTVIDVFTEFIDEKSEQLRFQTPAFLGLDEIKLKKLGELTVVTDLEHRTLYDMLQGRNQSSLSDYFEKMPNRERVLWVCTDMYRPFEKSIKQAFPNAKWVIDHYHVVAYANRAMDAIRITVQSKMTKENRIATKKGLAYTLRTRLDKMNAEEAAKIRECRENEDLYPLAVAFDLKEDFFNIYDENKESVDNAKAAFEKWEKTIPADPIYDDFRKLANTVHHFYEQIFNYWICPIAITNGFTECTNRIIRENNVRGRGNSFKILRGRTLYRYSNLEKIESNGMLIGPPIFKKGPVFHYEETDRVADKAEDERDYGFNSFDYDPMIGLIPGINFDPETGEIFDETLLDEE